MCLDLRSGSVFGLICCLAFLFLCPLGGELVSGCCLVRCRCWDSLGDLGSEMALVGWSAQAGHGGWSYSL